MGLRETLGHSPRWSRSLGACGEVLQQPHLHFQNVFAGLLLQALIQLVGILLAESTERKNKTVTGSDLTLNQPGTCRYCFQDKLDTFHKT